MSPRNRFGHAVQRVSSELQELRGRAVRVAKTAAVAVVVDDDGYPPGTGSCPCDECFEGIDLPDVDPGTAVCCKGHTKRTIIQPWLEAPVQGEMELLYIGDGLWATDTFDGPDCDGNHNEYRYLLTPSATASGSTLALELITDNGCDIACIVFVATLPYRCLCTNTFERVKWGNVAADVVSCRVCDSPAFPVSTDPHACGCFGHSSFELPLVWDADLGAGPAASLCPCTGFSGVKRLVTMDPSSVGISISPPGNYPMAFLGEQSGCGVPAADGRYWLILRCGNVGVGVPLVFGLHLQLIKESPVGVSVEWAVAGCGAQEDFSEPLILEEVGGGTTCTDWPDPITLTAVSGTQVFQSPTSDGSCAGCDTATAVPTPSGCCYEGECYEWDEPLCNDFGGTYYADADDCAEQCNPLGACCLNGGVAGCIEGSSEYECGLYGGAYAPDCDGCGSIGACCRADGSCEDDVLAGACVGAGETFRGPDSTCAGITSCLGSCCCESGLGLICCLGSNVTEAACYALPLTDCDGGTGEAVWVEGDITCSTCTGTC